MPIKEATIIASTLENTVYRMRVCGRRFILSLSTQSFTYVRLCFSTFINQNRAKDHNIQIRSDISFRTVQTNGTCRIHLKTAESYKKSKHTTKLYFSVVLEWYLGISCLFCFCFCFGRSVSARGGAWIWVISIWTPNDFNR